MIFFLLAVNNIFVFFLLAVHNIFVLKEEEEFYDHTHICTTSVCRICKGQEKAVWLLQCTEKLSKSVPISSF